MHPYNKGNKNRTKDNNENMGNSSRNRQLHNRGSLENNNNHNNRFLSEFNREYNDRRNDFHHSNLKSNKWQQKQ